MQWFHFRSKITEIVYFTEFLYLWDFVGFFFNILFTSGVHKFLNRRHCQEMIDLILSNDKCTEKLDSFDNTVYYLGELLHLNEKGDV